MTNAEKVVCTRSKLLRRRFASTCFHLIRAVSIVFDVHAKRRPKPVFAVPFFAYTISVSDTTRRVPYWKTHTCCFPVPGLCIMHGRVLFPSTYRRPCSRNWFSVYSPSPARQSPATPVQVLRSDRRHAPVSPPAVPCPSRGSDIF